MALRATSLGPKPSLFVFFCFFFFFVGSFPFFVFNRKHCFPKKGTFGLFLSVSLSFSMAFFGLPLLHFFFLCLSLSLSFLPSCLSFLLSFGLLFLSLSFFWFLPCFCFMKGRTTKKSLTKFLFINPFSFLLVSSLLFSFKSPFIIFTFFLILSFVFCSTSMFVLKNASSKNTNFGSRRGLQHNVFFQLVFCKM